MYKMNECIIVPFLSKNSGLGHIIRSLRLSRSLANAELYVNEENLKAVKKLLARMPKKKDRDKVKIVTEPRSSYQAIIIDAPEISWNELRNWKQYGPCIGVDAGGEGREYFDYLIDTIPNLFTYKANFYQLGLSIPSDIALSKQNVRSVRKVLYYPNAQQIQDLEKIHEVLRSRYIELTCVVFNEEMEQKIDELKIKKISCDIDVYKEIHRYDLFISHYGLSVFEALRAGVPVILINPSEYHQALSANFGFPHAFEDTQELLHYLSCLDVHSYTRLLRQCQDIVIKSHPSLDGFLEFLLESRSQSQALYCSNPSLGLNVDKVVYRSLNRTVYRCETLKQWYQYSYLEDMPSYDQAYFGVEYQQKYGKTYIEDLSNIEKRMKKRMSHIDSLLKGSRKKKASRAKQVLLDLGSGHGAMLKIVPKDEYLPIGVDIGKEAVEFSNGYSNACSYVLDLDQPTLEKKLRTLLKKHETNEVQVISAWFVLEHFPKIQNMVKTMHSLLSTGGVVAFAVPNARGISSISDFHKFCSTSPQDHYSLFTVHGLKKLLKNAGFKISKVRSTGFHPSRFPFGHVLYLFWYLLSKIFVLGDTFEIYAIKNSRAKD